MAYIEIFAGPVETGKKEAYRNYARTMGDLTLKAGALSVSAGWSGEEPLAMLKSLASCVELKPDEALVARIVRWESKDARDAGWAQMMKDAPVQPLQIEIPFDRTRVCHAGFEEL